MYNIFYLSSDPNDTFPVQLHSGNIDQDDWMEITQTSTYINVETGIPLSLSEYNTIENYAAGTIYDDGTPVVDAWSNIYTNTKYGFCYANYEITGGSVTSGSLPIGLYNATDYPENVSGQAWDQQLMWTLVDKGAGFSPRYFLVLHIYLPERKAQKR
mgnify:FL=1